VRATEESLPHQRLERIEALTTIDIPEAGRLRKRHREAWHFLVLRSDEGYKIGANGGRVHIHVASNLSAAAAQFVSPFPRHFFRGLHVRANT
jgi:hypothetical protein